MKTFLVEQAICKRIKRALTIGVALVLALSPTLAVPARADTFPEVISLPNGFNPEGITINGTDMYVGSLVNGAIYKADLRTGTGAILVQPQPGRVAAGMSLDPRTGYLFVAGVGTGHAYVYDAKTGANVADYTLTTVTNTLVNDVTITKDAVYFTDTFRPVFYKVPLTAGGRLPPGNPFQEIPLSGDFAFDPKIYNSNGIVSTPNGKSLIIAHSDLGRLYLVDPNTGQAAQINLGVERIGKDGSDAIADGLVLVGNKLYIIDFYNRVIPIQLNPNLKSGKIETPITSPTFQGPSTAARFGSSLYVVNAKLDIAPTPELTYTVSRVSR
jgi:sugar lactone lactonase YvrE